MFAPNFQYVAPMKDATIGEHTVKINDVRENSVKGFNCLEMLVSYENGEMLNPNIIRVFAPQVGATQNQIDAFNKKLSALKDAFQLTTNFGEIRKEDFINHVGKVEIAKNQDGYLDFRRFIV